MVGYRVCLLGAVQLQGEDGQPIEAPTGGTQLRALVAFALRPGHPRTELELCTAVWGDDINRSLAVPISHLRNKIPIPKKKRNDRTYTTSLRRTEVDATDFIDRATAASDLNVDEADYLLGVWWGDPEVLYDFLPRAEFLPLKRARAALITTLSTWSREELGRLTHLDQFRTLFEDECSALPTAERAASKTILLVDDDTKLTDMLTELLGGYRCVACHTLGEAMAVVTDPAVAIDGALVDLHLTKRQDSQGLEVLDAIRQCRPDMPRVLLTSSPPSGGMNFIGAQYGLYEILVKNGNDAPTRTRRTVDAMLSDSLDSALSRARATLDTFAARVSQHAQRETVGARRRLRVGTASPEKLDAALDQLEEADKSVESAKSDLRSCTSVAGASAVLAVFAQRWMEILEPGGQPT